MDESSAAEGLFDRSIDIGDEQTLVISQQEIGDEGAVVWDAALVLCAYCRHVAGKSEQDSDAASSLIHWSGKRVLELGAGTGVCGLQLAVLEAQCTITDLPHCLPLIQRNVTQNTSLLRNDTTPTVKALKWGEDLSDPSLRCLDYIILADCIYYEESEHSLVETLAAYCQGNTQVLCCFEQRETKQKIEQHFMQLVAEKFTIEEIPRSQQDPFMSSDDIKLYKFCRKK